MCGVGIESTMIEYCVNCEKETPYDRFDDINNRMYYVEGAGQLCCNCWHKIYNN